MKRIESRHMHCIVIGHYQWVGARADCCTSQWAVLRRLRGHKGQKSSPSSGHWLIDLTGRLYVCFGAGVCVCAHSRTIGRTGSDSRVSFLSFHPNFTRLSLSPLVWGWWHLGRLKCCVLKPLVGPQRSNHRDPRRESTRNIVSVKDHTHSRSRRSTFWCLIDKVIWQKII